MRWTSSLDDGLDFIGVDDSGDVGVGDDVSWKRGVDRVQSSEGGFGPDDESTQVGTWSQLQQAEGSDVGGLDTWDVSEGLDDTVILSVDDQRTSSLGESSASHLTLTCSHLLGLDDLDDVLVGVQSLQSSNGVLGLFDRLQVVGDNQWDFSNLFDSVTSSQNKGGDGGSSNGRSSGVLLFVVVHLDVPSSPDLGWSEHSTTSTHVTEGSLTGSVGTTTSNSWNSGDSSTGTPGFSRVLHTCVGCNSVSLSLVLVHLGEDRVDNIWSDWSLEDGWKW